MRRSSKPRPRGCSQARSPFFRHRFGDRDPRHRFRPYRERPIRRGALEFAPIYLANLAFAKRFSETENAPSAFKVNILGAMVGGSLEYMALLVGYRNLLVLAGLLYLAAFGLTPRRAARPV